MYAVYTCICETRRGELAKRFRGTPKDERLNLLAQRLLSVRAPIPTHLLGGTTCLTLLV